jgi:hypothetical protein
VLIGAAIIAFAVLAAPLVAPTGDIHSGAVREPAVGYHKVIRTALQMRVCVGYGMRRINFVSGSDQHMLQEPGNVLVVLDQ